MKRLLALAMAGVCLLAASPAVAEDLEGSATLGDCTLSPLTLQRANRADRDDRWVKLRLLVSCTEEYEKGRTFVKLYGTQGDGTRGTTRVYTQQKLDSPVTVGDHHVKYRIRCNWKKDDGTWKFPRRDLRVWSRAVVETEGISYERGDVWNVTTVQC